MALLEVRDVGVRFHGLVALDGVSLSVSRGEVVGLIGPNGAGKTTLFNTVTGLQRADSGTVSFDGRDVTALSADRRARAGIGRTFQTPQLIERLSVYDNILLGCQARMGNGLFADGLRLPSSWRNEVLAHREVDDVVAELGLGEHVHRGVGELPLGVRRLVEIARALCTRPRLLLLDEAASGIGREESGQLAELFSRIRREHDLSMLVVEHDVDFVLSLCDYVYVLDFGRLIARGTPDLVRANPDVIAAYLGQGGTLAFGRAPAVKAGVGGVPPSGARQRAGEEEGSAAAAAR